jgi:DNA-binding protein H-NS
MVFRRVIAGVIPACLVCVVAAAQEPAAPAAPDQTKEIAQLRHQVAQLQQQTKPTPAQQAQAAQDGYAAIFKEAKEKAGPACKALRGHLRVTVASDGKASVSCEF